MDFCNTKSLSVSLAIFSEMILFSLMNVARTVDEADKSLGQMVAVNLMLLGFSFGFLLQEKKKN